MVILAFVTLSGSLEDCWEGHSRHISTTAGHASGIAKHEAKQYIMKGYSVTETREMSLSKAGIVAEYIFLF